MEILRRNTPRWVIFIIDVSICIFSLFLAYLLRFNFSFLLKDFFELFYLVLPFFFFFRELAFLLGELFAGFVLYLSTKVEDGFFLVVFLEGLFFFLKQKSFYFCRAGPFIFKICKNFIFNSFFLLLSHLSKKES